MSAFKVTDLFLGEKNFIDFVDKNLGQERERLKEDELETDIVCSHLAGGILDYPCMISHDFADITTAMDIYIEAFNRDVALKIPKPYAFGVFRKSTDRNHRLGKMPFRGDELTVKQYINAVLGACPKIRNHIIDCTDEATSTGRLDNLYVIISNVVMIRNYLWVFLEIFEADNKPKLKVEYKEFCDLSEVLCEQMLQIFGNLLTTFILHDENSQNFSSFRAYYEGERGSPTIPMWTYFIRCMQRDMWRIMPPQLAQRILAIIINDSLAILSARYAKIKPTDVTNPQFTADIINILTSVEEFLFYISPELSGVCGQLDPATSKVLFSIHMKCHCLASTLMIVGCPLEVLYKAFRRGLSTCSMMDTRQKSLTKLTEPPWMSMLSLLTPKYYPTNVDYTDWELIFNLKLLCSQPSPSWSLVYKVVTMNECKIASFILSLFPTVVAPVAHFLLEGHGFKRCKHAACMDTDCHGLPKSLPDHLVSSCALYIVAHALPWQVSASVFRPILPRISDWSVMDKTQIWNSKNRPVWFQSLIDILLPILKTCVQSLVLNIAESVPKPKPLSESELTPAPVALKTSSNATTNPVKGKGSNPKQRRKSSVGQALGVTAEKEEELVTSWVIELLNTVTEILSIIPRGIFLVCEEMDDLIPRTFIPVRNNVPVHFLVTALYMLLNLGSGIINSIIDEEKPPPDDKAKKANSSGAKGAAPKKQQGKNKKETTPVPTTSYLEPCLFSTAERLCHLDDPVFDQVIHRLITQIESMMKHTKAQDSESLGNDDLDSDFALEWDISQLKADFLMELVEGQLAMRVVYWFLYTHKDMLENVLSGENNREPFGNHAHKPKRVPEKTPVNHEGPDSSKNSLGINRGTSTVYQVAKTSNNLLKIAPRIRTTLKPVNVVHDFHYVNKYRTFDEIIWSPRNLNWVQTVRHCRMGLQKPIIGRFLERRWEFKSNLVDEYNGVVDDKTRHLLKMVDEIKALILT